jgi:hypothetical protein
MFSLCIFTFLILKIKLKILFKSLVFIKAHFLFASIYIYVLKISRLIHRLIRLADFQRY